MDMPQEIRSLIAQCEANIVGFSNDQMSVALHFGESMFRQVADRPQWHAQPPRNGLYLYANKAKDWDISEPVGVSSVDYCDGKGAFLTANYRRERVLVTQMPGIWWGPLPTPTYADKPSPELEAKA